MRNGQLKVMHLISNLDIGGAQEVVRTLAAYLAEAGCEPVVCTFKDGPLRQEIEQLGIPVEVVPARRYSVVAFPKFVKDMLRLRRILLDLVQKHHVHVVQTHLLRVLDFLVLTLRDKTNTPLIFWTAHNTNEELQEHQLPRFKWLLKPKRLGYRLLYRLTARSVNGFIAVADGVKTELLKTIGPIEDKITVICNGVDVKRYQRAVDRVAIRRKLGLPEQAHLIAVVGTLKRQKGHSYLIEAASSLVSEYLELHILFIGDGDLSEELQAQTRAAGLDQHIHFLGSRYDVPDLLAASDYFVLPSLWEGLPMALIEAMASGLPIVATDVSGTRQVLTHGETGFVVPPGDAQRLKEAIHYLLSDPPQARALGAAAQRRIEDFSAQKQAQEHIALYHREWIRSRGAA
jgi:glycosyltransferase involved in cell wall biosynthesis